MHVRIVDTVNHRDVERFINFPFSLYRKDPNWVPPLISSMRATLDRSKHPFYRHSNAEFFLAEADGEVLGRIAVIQNNRYNRYRHEKDAFFGYFEAVEDPQVAGRLFEAAHDWAGVRGLERVLGPRGLIGTDGGGVLVDGFEHPPSLGYPYNPPYYDDLIQSAGYEKDTDHFSAYLPGTFDLPQRFYRIAEKVKCQRGYWIKVFRSKREIRRWIPRILAVHQQAFQNALTYVPPTQEEQDQIIETLMLICIPDLVKLVMKGEEVIGFILAYPDISEGLKKSKGRLWPFGWFHILRSLRKTNWVNINGVGILPEYQGLGANTVLYTELAKTIHAMSYQHADLVQADEKNFKSRSDLESMGVKWYKTHRSYRQVIAPYLYQELQTSTMSDAYG